jgi:glycosyltransferase involved in cell wall biosynthesis
MSTMLLNRVSDSPPVSIIITNHNYASYLRDAVDSALGQDYKQIEVIVVDDGSTDISREILAEYGDRIKVILKDNGGQASSVNAGYRECHGRLVMTLDADDMLEPTAISKVVNAWTPDFGEIHFPLKLINQDGSERPGLNPSARIASGNLAAVLLEKGRYVGPPSSGNVYSRAVLDKIMPIPENVWRHSDCYLETLGPFYGSVVALDEPLGRYRIHSSNFSTVKELDRNQIEFLISHDRMQDVLLTEFCSRHNLPFRPGTGLSHWGHLKLLLALERTLTSPSRRQTCGRFLCSVWRSKDELTLTAKIRLMAWALSTTLLPGSAGKALVLLAFSRPQLRRG